MQIRRALVARVPQALRRSPRGPRNPLRLLCPLVLVTRRSPLRTHRDLFSDVRSAGRRGRFCRERRSAVCSADESASREAMISVRFIRARVLCSFCLPRLRICFEAERHADEGNYSEAPSLAAFCALARLPHACESPLCRPLATRSAAPSAQLRSTNTFRAQPIRIGLRLKSARAQHRLAIANCCCCYGLEYYANLQYMFTHLKPRVKLASECTSGYR